MLLALCFFMLPSAYAYKCSCSVKWNDKQSSLYEYDMDGPCCGGQTQAGLLTTFEDGVETGQYTFSSINSLDLPCCQPV